MTASLWSTAFPTAGTVDDRDLPPEADVAIVGAGYTGLWTAYYLLGLDPSLRVTLIEAQRVGFGASGRNGGWCSGLFPVAPARLARRHGRAAAIAMLHAVQNTVAEVGAVVAAEGIDCDWLHGGTVALARTPGQLRRAAAEVTEAAAYELGLQLLGAPQAQDRCRATGVLGATYSEHCAALHPLKLVRGLAEAVTRRGATIAEGTRALRIEPGQVVTDRGVTRAGHIIRATEGYTAELAGQRRTVLPVYSLMIATAPLPESTWDAIGLTERETFTDQRRLVIYGQRTGDGRLAFGGRGAPYHFGSRVSPAFDQDQATHAALRRTLVELFPQLADVEVTHAWGGPLGIHRDWHPSVGLDPATGLGWAGGYVGDGVAATNLAGRTLADLITGRTSELAGLPWVNHRSRRWEPEPIRWLGVNTALRAVALTDRLRP